MFVMFFQEHEYLVPSIHDEFELTCWGFGGITQLFQPVCADLACIYHGLSYKWQCAVKNNYQTDSIILRYLLSLRPHLVPGFMVRIPSFKVVHVALQTVLGIVPTLGFCIHLALSFRRLKLIAGIVTTSTLPVLLPVPLDNEDWDIYLNTMWHHL